MHADEPSLQSHLDDLRARTGAPEGVSTVILCGKMRSENDSAEVLAMHRSIVEKEVNSEGSNVTGLLMGQGTSVLHLLEGPSYALLRIVKELADHPHYTGENGTDNTSTSGSIQQARIAYNVEDRPRRFYPEWYSCVLAEKKGGNEELNGDTGKDVVHDMATQLLEMGSRLQATTGAVDLSSYAEMVPAKGLILALNNCTAFFTLDEYVSLYSEPFHLDLESELVYPVQRLVSYI